MGASTQTQNESQHSTTQPWAPAIPGLQNVIGDATNLYNSGAGTGIYSGQRVADLTDDQSYGIQATRDQAAADNSGAIGTSWLQGVLGSNGISPTTQTGLGMLSSLTGVTKPGSVLDAAGLDGNGLTQGQVGALGDLKSVQGVDLSRLSGLADRLGDPNSGVNRTANAFMSGSRDLTTQPLLEGLLAKSQQTSAAETNLSGVARGDYLDPTANPYLQAAVKAANQNADTATRETFAQSGRYGSGNHAAATTKAINDTDTALYANQYNQERANQLSANGQIDAARQAASSLGTGITNAISGVQSTNNSQRMAGAGLAQSQTAQQAGVLGQLLSGGEFNSSLDMSKAQGALSTYGQGASARLSGATTDAANDLNSQEFNSTLGLQKAQGFIGAGQSGMASALSASGQLPALDALRYAPGQQMLGVGGLQQNQNQAGIGAGMQMFGEQQSMPWSSLSRYAGLLGGIGGLGGETNSTGTRTQSSQQSTGQTLLGGAMGLGGMAANLNRSGAFGAGGLSGLFGSGSGAAAGAAEAAGGFSLDALLPAAFMLSDERAKENVEEVGALHDGQPIYRYNYKGDAKPQIGLLAQEVAEREPGAVGLMPGMGGLLGVDYGRATERSAHMARGR